MGELPPLICAIAIEIAEYPDLGAVMNLLVDEHCEHATSGPFDPEVRRSHLIQRDVIDVSQRFGNGTLALDEVVDRTLGVAMRSQIPEVANSRSE